MIYLATASGPKPREAIASGLLGQMVTPAAGNRIVPGAKWALDNGCFANSWTYGKWLDTLSRHKNTDGCLFAVVPDVVGDAHATDAMWGRWWSAPMRQGYNAAYVAQDGCRYIPMGATALFIGGSTEWKLGAHARRVVREAHRRSMWVHMGRVNSYRRWAYAESLGCHSVDGTFLAFGPDVNLPRLLSWVNTPTQLAMELA